MALGRRDDAWRVRETDDPANKGPTPVPVGDVQLEVINKTVERLYKEHGFYVFQRCRTLLGDPEEASDAMQEVFCKLIRARPRLDDPNTPILAWLNRVTTNDCLNRLRARRYRRHSALHELPPLRDDSPTALLHALSESRQTVRRLLSDTDERTQRVVVAYFFDEHDAARIARELGISVPTVRRVLKRFLVRAREKLLAERHRALEVL